MNVPQIAATPNAAPPEPEATHAARRAADAKRTHGARRPQGEKPADAHAHERFEVPEDPPDKPPRPSGARDDGADLDHDAKRASAPEAPRAEDIAAWMLSALTQITPPAEAPHVDVTDPHATLDTPATPSPDPDISSGAGLRSERGAASPRATAQEAALERDPSSVDADAEPPASDVSDASAKPHTPARDAPALTRASTQIDASKLSATLTAKAQEAAPRDDVRPATAALREDAASSELASASLSAPGSPWASAAATPSTRLTDNGLTAVNGPTQAPDASPDPLRERLMSAQTSAINQRTIERAAHGEVVIPELGRVSVTARSEREAVTIEVRAAQAATAQVLHAHAGAIAADVRAADIPVASLSFDGAGTWTSADAHASSHDGAREREARGSERDEAAATTREATRARPSGRVRIVL
ncbi:MAG: hypothetical protein U0326_30265 [Polyangiales bacterium]